MVTSNSLFNFNTQITLPNFGIFQGALAYGNAYFGAGNGSIFLNYVDCTGNENSLLHCGSSKIGSNNCGHSQDAGVHCAGMKALLHLVSFH